MRYLHYKSRAGEAARLAKAFEAPDLASGPQANGLHEPAAAFHAVPPAEAETPAERALSWHGAEAP